VLVETYGQAVRNALREVDDALGAALQAQQQELLQRVQVKQAETELNLADARYQAGSGDLMGVLEMQRSLLTAEDTLNQQVLARLTASLTLYKALGGAWAEAPELSDSSDQDR
jgi:outer membrane protein TolC